MTEPPRSLAPEVAASAFVLAYGALTPFLPQAVLVPANLAAAAAVTAFAHRSGTTLADMGLERDRVKDGLSLGWKVALPVAATVLVGIAIPASRELFTGDAAMNMPPGEAAFDMLVRIPFGTVIPEELIFRGALLGMFLRRHEPWKAAALSSLLFGVWHVFPTLDRLQTNPAGDLAGTYAFGHGAATLVTVGLTAAAGMGFSWLRLRSGSVVAPMLTHLTINETATVGGRIAKKVLHLARMRRGIIGTI